MEPRTFFYVANWKTYFSYAQAVEWCTEHAHEFQNHNVVICPEFTALAHASKLITTGAQNCSSYTPGAHTGQVTIASIKEVGANYCIVGHSEVRTQLHETPDDVADKVALLIEHEIIPILCVSDEIAHELTPILKKIKNTDQIMIAYEPVSAIGTGTVPENSRIESMLNKIKKLITQHAPQVQTKLLYGGSVNAENAKHLKSIELLDGFLIGKASTDFQLLKKIVEL